jgi:hypothetical protein
MKKGTNLEGNGRRRKIKEKLSHKGKKMRKWQN